MTDPITLCKAIVIAAQTGVAPLYASQVDLACKMAPVVVEQAAAAKIRPAVIAALIYVESGWTPSAVSHAGACGLTQVIPRYVPETCKDLKQAPVAVSVGVRILSRWRKMKGAKDAPITKRVLACYNAGHACLRSPGGRRYAGLVMRLASRLEKIALGVRDD